MKVRPLQFIVFLLIVVACSSGKKAYQRGDYFDAVVKAVERLKQKPDHEKSKETLKNAYPMALQNLEQESQNILASNDNFKYKNTIQVYNRINQLYEVVKSSPGAMSVVKNPKNYYAEIGPLKEKASEELYTAGIQSMMKGMRKDYREAYFYFKECEGFVPRYKEALEMMTQSEKDGTLRVMYDESNYNRWYSPANTITALDKVQFLDLYHQSVAINEMGKTTFDLKMMISVIDYTESKPQLSRKDFELTDSVKVSDKVVNNVKVPVYQKIKGKYTSVDATVQSTGRAKVVINDSKTGNVVFSEEFTGYGQWKSNWGNCSGDQRVFSKTQKQLCDKGEQRADSNALRKQAQEDLDKKLYSRLSSFLQNY